MLAHLVERLARASRRRPCRGRRRGSGPSPPRPGRRASSRASTASSTLKHGIRRAAWPRRICGGFPWPGIRGCSWRGCGEEGNAGSDRRDNAGPAHLDRRQCWSPSRRGLRSSRLPCVPAAGSSCATAGAFVARRVAAVELEGLAVAGPGALARPCVWNAAVASVPASSVMCVQPRTPPSNSFTRW